MTSSDVRRTLERLPVFGALPPELLDTLAGLAGERRLADGEYVFREGDAGDAWYVVVEGEVRIVRDLGGDEVSRMLLTTLGRGASFGEMAVFDDAPRSASALAHGDMRLVAIGRAGLHRLLSERPADVARLLLAIVSNLSGTVRRATTELVTVYETGKIAGTVRDPQALAQQVIAKLHVAAGADRSAVGIWNPFSEEYQWVRHEPAGVPEGSPEGALLGPEHPLIIGAFEQGEAIVAETGPLARTDEPWLGSVVIVAPLYAEGEGQGVMVLAADRAGAFGGDQQNLVSAVAVQVSGALAMARHEQDERDRERLARMRQGSRPL